MARVVWSGNSSASAVGSMLGKLVGWLGRFGPVVPVLWARCLVGWLSLTEEPPGPARLNVNPYWCQHYTCILNCTQGPAAAAIIQYGIIRTEIQTVRPRIAFAPFPPGKQCCATVCLCLLGDRKSQLLADSRSRLRLLTAGWDC